MGFARQFSLRSIRTLLVATLTVAALAAAPAGVGHADRTPTPAEAARQVAALTARMEKATEAYDSAREQVNRSQRRAAALATRERAQAAAVDGFRTEVGDFAASAYRSGSLSELNSLLDSGSPETFLQQLATLDRLSREQRLQLDQLIAGERALAAAQRDLSSELALQQASARTAAATKASIERDLATWRRLSIIAQRAAAARAAAAAAAAARQAPVRASRSAVRTSSAPSAPAQGGTYTGSATGSAGAALSFAYAQLGKPYSFGAAGPGSYDCSGLTMASWRAGGVSLPHSSRMQFNSGPHVSRSALQPGDLVFFGSPISHVAIYIGGGRIIHAPVPGDVVKIASLGIMSYAGAVRP